MKNLKYFSKGYLLPLCFLFVFGLMSCQQEEEIIPLEKADLVTDETTEFDTGDATDFIYNEKGELIGYLDQELEPRSLNGAVASNGREDFWNPLRVVLYKGALFKGSSAGIHMGGRNVTYNARINVPSGYSGATESMVITPGCRVTVADRLYDGQIDVSKSYTFPASETAQYIKSFYGYSFPSGVPLKDNIRHVQIQCSNKEDRFCGYFYMDPNYQYRRLPFFKDADIDFSNDPTIPSYWDNAISSISTNRYSACDGVMMYNDPTDVDQGYEWYAPDTDYPVMTTTRSLSGNFENKTTRLFGGPSMVHEFEHVNFPIGAIAYDDKNFKGNKAIFPKGYDKSVWWWNWDINSLIVAPDVRFEFTRSAEQGFFQQNGPGYYPDKNFDMYEIRITSVDQAGENDFCGVAYQHQNAGGEALPIFNKLYNYPSGGSSEFLRIPDIGGYTNNSISEFQPYDGETSCQGVTFWDNGSNGRLNSQRRWVAVNTSDQVPVEFSDLNNKISAITTEGCTSKATGMDAQVYNTMAKSINTYTNKIQSLQEENELRNGRPLYLTQGEAILAVADKVRTRKGVAIANAIVGLAASIATYYVDIPNIETIVGAGLTVSAASTATMVFIKNKHCQVGLNRINEEYLKDLEYNGNQLELASEFDYFSVPEMTAANKLAMKKLADISEGGIIFRTPEARDAYLDTDQANFPPRFGTDWTFAVQPNILVDGSNVWSVPTEFDDPITDISYLQNTVGVTPEWLQIHPTPTLRAMLMDQTEVVGQVRGQTYFFNLLSEAATIVQRMEENKPVGAHSIPQSIITMVARLKNNMKVAHQAQMAYRSLAVLANIKKEEVAISTAAGVTFGTFITNIHGWAVNSTSTNTTGSNTSVAEILTSASQIPSSNPSGVPSLLPTIYANITYDGN